MRSEDYILQKFKAVERAVESRGKRCEIDLNPPATSFDLSCCEEAIGVAFPPSLRKFLNCHNGATLTIWAENIYPEDTLHVYDTTHISINTKRFLDLVNDGGIAANGRFIAFAVTASDSDRFLLYPHRAKGLEEYPVIFGDHGEPKAWEHVMPVIAKSFEEWLDRSLAAAEQGLRFDYWLEE
jgi:hypothetical protein